MGLSDSWLKANAGKNQAKSFEKTDRDGLSVRVTPKGKITFQLRYRYQGKAARLDLGSYPLMSLKEARAESLRFKSKLEQGYDPRIVKQLERVNLEGAITLEALYRQWFESQCKGKKESAHEIGRSFEIHILPVLGHLPANDITLHIWLEHLELKAKLVPAVTSRLLTNIKEMLDWGVRRQLIDANVIASITAKKDLNIKKGTRVRSLTNDEIRYFWFGTDPSRILETNKIFLKLNLFYACRNGELRLSEKSHYDFNKMVWTVPPENHKTGRYNELEIKRPIIPEVMPLIERAFELAGDSKYVFNNRELGVSVSSKKPDAPMGKNAPLSLPYGVRRWLKKNIGHEMEHWSTHDLRKTARTHFSELTQPHVAEIMLAHKLPGEWQTYDDYDYLKEQADAYSKWWARLMEIIAEPLS